MISRLCRIALALLLIAQTVYTGSFDASTCGVSKSCFVPLDDECWDGCGGLRFSYKMIGETKMQVEFSSTVTSNTGFYIAVGFSHDALMGQDSVLECSSLGAQPASLKWSYNPGTTNVRIGDASVITDSTVTFENSVVYCSGIVDVTGGANPQQFKYVPNTEYYLLMAYGPTSPNGLLHHIHETNTNHPVKLEQIQNVVSTIDLSGCGTSMGCFIPNESECYGKPEGVTFTYAKLNDNYFHFQLFGKGHANGNAFVAVGFSGDNMMGNESVLECSSLGKNAATSLKFSYNNGKPTNVRIAGEEDVRDNLISSESQYVNGMMYCDGLVKVSGDASKPEIFNFDSSLRYNLLLAVGTADAKGLVRHSISCVSSFAIDLASVQNVQNNFDTSTCGVDKACYMPTDKNGMAFSFKLLSQSKMQVEFTTLMAQPNQYVAVGFSVDNMMGNDTVIECSSIDGVDNVGEFSIKYSYNNYNEKNRPTNERLTYDQSLPLVTNFTSVARDGELYCKAVIDITGAANPLMLTFDNVTDYFLLMASGATQTGGLMSHHHNDAVSSVVFNMASVQPRNVPATPSPQVNINSTLDLSQCGISMGCYVPAVQDCNNGAIDGLTVTYTKLNDSYFHFQLVGKPLTGDNSFIAVGFSNDVMMGNESVLECSSLGANAAVSFKFSYNNAHPTNVRIDGEDTIRSNYITDTSKYTEGLLYCDGVVKVSGDPTRPQIFKWDPSAKYHLLLAMGVADSNGLKGHRTGTTCISPMAKDLASVQNNFDTSTCGVDKACFTPTDKNGMAFSYKVLSQRQMRVELTSVMAFPNQYVAVGFSLDNMMGNDTVIECSSIEGVDKVGEFSIKYSYNIYDNTTGRPTNERLQYNSLTPLVTDFSFKAQDGEIYCTGVVDITGTDNPLMITYNDVTNYYLLMASGNTTKGGLTSHGHNNAHSGDVYNMDSVQPLPAPTPTPATNTEFDCSQCSVTKSCFFQGGASCSGSGVAWKMLDDKNMELELINPGTEQYMAVGFGVATGMGGSNVIECSKIGANPYSMKFSYNNDAPRNVRIDGEQAIESTYFVDETVKNDDGRLYCKAKVNVGGWDGSSQVFKWDNSQAYYVLIAKGPTSDSGLGYHTFREISPSAVKLDSIGKMPDVTSPAPPPNNADFDCSQCSVTKSCFFQGGASCSGGGVAWRMVDEKNMELELINPGTEQYMAVGFGVATGMGGSNVIECSTIDSKPYSMKFSYNNDSPRNVRIDGEQAIESTYFVDATVKNDDGRLYCKAKVNVGGWDGSSQVFKLDSGQSYYVLIAKGPTTTSGLGYHTSKQISPSAVKLDSIGSLTATTPPLILAHAILMILAWICFIPTALLFARFLRNSWPMYKPGGLLIWFHVHRTCNMLGICMMIASFACIMTQNKWKWSGPGSNHGKWQKDHTMVGLIALVLAWLQPFISTMRCSPNNAKRPIFNWIHRGIGTIAFILAITAMSIASYHFTGIWSNTGVQLGLTLAAMGVVIVMCCIFPILDHLQSKETTDHKNWERIRQIVVLIALLFLFGDAIALSVLVGVGKPAI